MDSAKFVSKNLAGKYERLTGYHLNVTMDFMIVSFLEISLSILMEGIYIIPLYVHTYIYTIILYPQASVLSFPRLISVAQVNEYRTTDVTKVLKAPGAELCLNTCGVVNQQKTFCSHQCCVECSMNKFRAYISIFPYYPCIYIYIYIYIYVYIIY